jgi:3',5'-cyclic AMP phosphodiesterase CpdA
MTLIFHVSDLHFGVEDPAALAWFAAQVAERRPDAVVVTGDITMRARHSEFRAAQAWLEALPSRVSVEVGNHDLPYFNLFARFTDPYGRFEGLARKIGRPLDLPGVDIVPLRTTARLQWRLNWSKGHASAARIAQTADAVARAEGPLRIVACHHPLVDPPTRGSARTRGGAWALEVLARSGAHAILSGHVHDPYDHMVTVAGRQVRLIGAGTLSERVRDSLPSYNAIRATADGLSVDIRYAA